MIYEAEQLKGFTPSLRTSLSMSLGFMPVVLACLLLIACGGGGGSNSGSNSNVTMYISPQTVSVSAMTTQPAPTSSFEVSVAGLALNGEVWIGTTYTGHGIANTTVSSGYLPATVTVQFKSPASLGPGTYDDTVTVNVCLDQSCSQPLSDSPQTVQVQYTVTKSTFAITSLSPSSAYAGAQGLVLTVNGSTFTQQSAVLWNGNSLPTTFLSSSQLTAQIPASDIATAGTATVSVSDPNNGVSNTETFTVNPSPLAISSLSPSNINAGGPAFTLNVTGTSFTSQSMVLWNGQPLTTTFVNATQLTAQIPAANITTPGSATVSVSDPTYGTSNGLMLTINVPPLAISSISPTSATVGGPAFTLTVLGTSFTGTSTVKWNSTALTTTLVSSTELLAQIPATDINATGTASVIVSDPNSPPGTTSAQTVAIVPPSKDAVAFQINPAHTGAVTFNSVSFPSSAAWSVNVGGNPSYALIMQDKVIVTVKLSDGSSQLLALNQVTGSTVWGPIPIQGSANATYDNGRVFVVNEPYPADATLMAFDVATGALDWTTTLNSYGAGPPTAADGIIYVEQETGGVEAVAESSGAPLWTGATDPGFGTAAVTEDGVYIGMTCESYDLRPATGEVIWSYQINCSGGGPGTPVVANQLDYSPDSEYVSGGDIFNAETGVNVGTYVAGTPATFSQTMGYFLQSGTLRGVTLANNTVQWSFSGDGELIGSPIMVNQYVLIGSSLGNVYALDGTTGTQIWNVNLGTTIGGNSYELPFTGLAAGDGLLIVPSGTTVTAYTLSTNP